MTGLNVPSAYRGMPYPPDHHILMEIWRWKVVGSMGFSHYLSGKSKAEYPYRKLAKLNSKGLVAKVVSHDGRRMVWSLTNTGYRYIKAYLPTLQQDGFKAEYPRHDFICSAIQLASHLAFPGEGIKTFSEQELRRYSLSAYPFWVPKAGDHRSDGYWCIPKEGKLKLMALEVELSHQSHDKYRRIGSFYHQNDQIEEVLWVFKNLPDAVGCLSAINRLLDTDAKYHRFTSLEHLVESGWDAPTYVLDHGQIKAHQKLVQSLSTATPKSDLRDFLNMRKCHFKSDSYLFPN